MLLPMKADMLQVMDDNVSGCEQITREEIDRYRTCNRQML